MRNVQEKRGRLARILLRLFIVCFVVSLTSIIVLITNSDVTDTPEYKETHSDVTDTPEYKETHSGSEGLLYSLTQGGSSYIVARYEGSPGKNITIPSAYNGKKITGIGSKAFQNCSFLTNIVIPNSVKNIGSSAFRGCTGLTSITIPNSVTSIGYEAFYNCKGLTSVTIPDSVTSIGDRAFYGCTGLESVTIPDSVTSIGYQAFLGCTGLTRVTIPNSVTSIGFYAFYGCKSLTRISYQGTKAQWNAISKGSDWNYSTGSYTINCTDGVIAK